MDYKNTAIGCLPEDRPERIARGLFASRSATRLDVSHLYNIKIFFKIKNQILIEFLNFIHLHKILIRRTQAIDRKEGQDKRNGRKRRSSDETSSAVVTYKNILPTTLSKRSVGFWTRHSLQNPTTLYVDTLLH